MEKKSVEELEASFGELVANPPFAADKLAALVKSAPAQKGGLWAAAALKAYEEAACDFEGAFLFATECHELLSATLQGEAGQTVREALRHTTKDRKVISFIDGAGFGARPLKEALGRLGRLLSFTKGAFVISAAWGLGEVGEINYFYRRVPVDFRTRKGHQFTYDAACETLAPAPQDHILVKQRVDPDLVAKWLKDEPGVFVKEMLRSFGDMPITRLEELSAMHGFVKSGDTWKKFWERARAALRQDKCVEIPTRRAEAAAEDYGEVWFTAFAQMRDPKSILSNVRELQAQGRLQGLDDDGRAKIADRLAFALKGARGVDDALYSRIAFCIDDLKLDQERVSKARAYLWAEDVSGEPRYLAAARSLPAREVGNLVAFLSAENRDEARGRLLAALPQMCFTLLSETVAFFKEDPECQATVAGLLKSPSAPATLVTLVLGRYGDFKQWQALPPLVVVLTHAIALGEGRQGGETLRMQNMIRRLFADQKWLGEIFAQLGEADQALFFERFQASISWDPSTHHMIVVRMTRLVPALAARQTAKEAPKREERITSFRSYAERQAAYERLVNVEIPENTKRIEFARSYGDLSENAEYQYAKDEQRALMQKQSVMQDDLAAVKPGDFSDATTDEVMPGVTVVIAAKDGEKTWTVLGEWDNDLPMGIISSKTRVAQNMLGKKVGDSFELPDAEGGISFAEIREIRPIGDEIREWMKLPPGVEI